MKMQSNYRFFVFVALAFAYMFVYFNRMTPAVLADDMMKAFDTGGTIIGLMSSAFFYAYLILQFPSGILLDRFGPRKLVTGCCLLGAIGAFAFSLADGIGTAIIARILIGAGMSAIFISTLHSLMFWFEGPVYARMVSWLLTFGGAGTLIAATPLAFISSIMGWRGCFIIIGLGMLCISGLVWFFVRDCPEDAGLPPVVGVHKSSSITPKIPFFKVISQAFQHRDFCLLVIWAWCFNGVFLTFAGLWSGPYLTQVYGLSKVNAGGIISFFAIGMVICAPIYGYLSVRLGKPRYIQIFTTFGQFSIISILWLSNAHMPMLGLMLCFFLLGGFNSGGMSMNFATVKNFFPVHMTGRIFGLFNIFPSLGPAILQPFIGYILDNSQALSPMASASAFNNMFIAFLICSGIAIISILSIKPALAKG